MDKFNLLIKNPVLNSYTPVFATNNYITDILAYPLSLPITPGKSFIFSSYALSIDGKLYYPDIKSGFSIAGSNHHASQLEKNADFFMLMLARTISDAIIVGTNSINNEPDGFSPDIMEHYLLNLRLEQSKAISPTTFVICRDLSNINFQDQLFSDDKHQVVICCLNRQTVLANLPDIFSKFNLGDLDNKNQFSLKNLVFVDNWATLVDKLYILGFNVILNESPYFHHQLLQLKRLDEIWLNYSGSYIGGSLAVLGGNQVPFASNNHPDCEILTLHNLGYNFLYTRQKILYN